MDYFTYHTLWCPNPLECWISTYLPAWNTQQRKYKIKVPSTIYNPMLITKELNNETSDSYKILFMGKELLLHKWNKREKLQPRFLVLRSLFSSKTLPPKLQTFLPNAHSPRLDLKRVFMFYHNLPPFTHEGWANTYSHGRIGEVDIFMGEVEGISYKDGYRSQVI